MKKLFGLFLFALLLSSLFAEQIYDSRGNLIRSSQWLQRTPPKKETEPVSAIEVTESEPEDEPLIPEQQSMKSVNLTADKVYGQEEIENSACNSLPDFLQEKGFLIMASGGSGTKTELSYKGFTSFCIKVYIDGILANNASSGEFDWNSIDLNSIESIVVSEVPPVGISEFAGACIFITTKGTNLSFLQTETALDSYETNFLDGLYQSFNYGSLNNKLYYRLAASTIFADNEYNRADAGENTYINKYNFSRMANANLNWNYSLAQNHNLSGAHTLAYNQVKAFGTTDSLTTGIEEDFTTQNNLTYTYEKDNLRSQTIASYFYGQINYLNQYRRTGSDIDKTKLQNIAIRQNLSWYFDASAGFRQEHLFSNQGDRFQLDLGLSKEFSFGDFVFTPCLQTIAYSQQDGWHFQALPRLTLTYAGNLTLAAYRTFTLPTFNQLYWPDSASYSGNSQLNPEQGWSVTLSYNPKTMPFYARFTYSYYENKIRWTNVEGKLMPMNTANADYYIAAAGYEDSFWENRIHVTADATMTQARLRQTYKQIMWVPEYQLHGSFNFKYKNFQALADYSWTSWRYKQNDNQDFYPAFHMLDLNLSYQINPEFQLYAKVTNLLDQRVPYHDGYYIPSRKWTLGLKIKR